MLRSTLLHRLAPLTFLLAAPLGAQDLGPPVSTEERIRALEDTVRRQAQKIERLEAASGETDPARIEAAVDRYLETKEDEGELTKLTAGWDGKFFVKSEDDAFRLEIGGYGDTSGRFFQREYGGVDTWYFREVRPHLYGYLWKDCEFKLQLGLEASSVRMMDGWINLRHIPEAQLKFGQFKQPFGLDQLTGTEVLEFAERSILGKNFAPSRDPSVQLHGKLFEGLIEYAAAVSNGDGLNAGDSNDEKDFAGRVVVTPFKKTENWWVKGLRLGGNATHGVQGKSLGGRTFLTAGDSAWFRFASGVESVSTLDRVGADFAWYVGPASIKGEWNRLTYDDLVLRGATRAQDVRRDFLADGYYVSASYLLTGEDRTAAWVKPKANFDPRQGTWGAWELVGRYEYVDLNHNVFSDRLATGTESLWGVAGGINWYLNPNVRVMADYEYTRFAEDVAVGGQTQDDEHVVLFRVQFQF